jgi:hypothetical protein
MTYTLQQVEGFLTSNLVDTVRTTQEVKRQIDGLTKTYHEYSDLQIEVLLGATTAITEQGRYDDEHPEESEEKDAELWDEQESNSIYEACLAAEMWLEDEKKPDLF